MLLRFVPVLSALAAIFVGAASSQAQEIVTYETTIKGASFTPAEIKVPANKPFIIKLTNTNASPVELESNDLKIEKIAAGNSSIIVRVKAQAPGKYLFVDEFQEDVAKGYVIVE